MWWNQGRIVWGLVHESERATVEDARSVEPGCLGQFPSEGCSRGLMQACMLWTKEIQVGVLRLITWIFILLVHGYDRGRSERVLKSCSTVLL